MNSSYEKQIGEFLFSTDKTKIDIATVHDYLSNESYWAKNIPLDVVNRSIEGSVCFGIYLNDQQIGFARVVTDEATFAYLADVFIKEEYRGKGLSKQLMEFIHAHPNLQGLRRWLLGTRDAHTLYEQFGWTRFTEEIYPRFMQLHDPNVYS
jgi:GNAT superfamily N-acetyltransferase